MEELIQLTELKPIKQDRFMVLEIKSHMLYTQFSDVTMYDIFRKNTGTFRFRIISAGNDIYNQTRRLCRA